MTKGVVTPLLTEDQVMETWECPLCPFSHCCPWACGHICWHACWVGMLSASREW